MPRVTKLTKESKKFTNNFRSDATSKLFNQWQWLYIHHSIIKSYDKEVTSPSSKNSDSGEVLFQVSTLPQRRDYDHDGRDRDCNVMIMIIVITLPGEHVATAARAHCLGVREDQGDE